MAYIGLSGLQMAKSGLETSGHNIANAETVGFKEFRNILSDSYAQATGGSHVEMSGVRVSAMEQMFSQGSLKLTGNSFDMAIEGKGFFTLNDDGRQLFSRSGYFRLDKDGFVVNQDGYRLQGFQTGVNGQISLASRGDLKSGAQSVGGKPTTTLTANVNLDANEKEPASASNYNWTTSFSVFDSLGTQHFLGVGFRKTATDNLWTAAYRLDDASTYTAMPSDMNLRFNSQGKLDTSGDANVQLATNPGNGAATMNINLDLSAITQYASDFSVSNIERNGYESGTLNQVSMGDDGFLEALYSNGERKRLGQVMVATFPSEVGLTVQGNNCWAESTSSGEPVFNISGKGGTGLVRGGVLEQSNVDITQELLNLVMEQRNYQLNARTIKAEDAMSQTLLSQLG
ncbi:flagellar hook protein FlgE [Sansalvadorimonas sp. 2012CJ34-2]|uniref:Flagellar hook protein FlgE n=1 Tax=Parendozoicomonas callyspongiae TaxID=2942213 RepID=A0ABT0PEC0_9GAMM|nr:flagellar hook protein FlgE [Sansalvadorimonas sp. 2012CJ34-2]MCL6269551.1 flagellar hook protein FlgE [Sansalvadorimonas sp. 2012CJ34-2]